MNLLEKRIHSKKIKKKPQGKGSRLPPWGKVGKGVVVSKKVFNIVINFEVPTKQADGGLCG
jgi:hypothetical protein